MHNALARAQQAFGGFTTFAFFIACLVALSDLLAPRTPSAEIKPEALQVFKGRPHYYSTKKEEYASIRFSLEADLSSLFTWNTKQIFVYVTAEWPDNDDGASYIKDNNHNSNSSKNKNESQSNGTSAAIIWDQIITSPSADFLANLGPATLRKLRKSAQGKAVDPSRGLLSLKNQKPKYQISHPSGKMADVSDVILHLHYNVQPWVGALTWNQNVELWNWKEMAGGLSETFSLPPLKNKI